jgi:hypothetical protein
MNFFKQISSAVDKINSIGNMTHQKNLFGGKTDPLTELIKTCTYTDEYPFLYLRVKFIIEKSVKQILQVYPSYLPDKLEYGKVCPMQSREDIRSGSSRSRERYMLN